MATYSITVWTTQAASKGTTVGIAVGPAAHVSAPRFTACPSSSGTTCSLGNMPVGHADNLQASAQVGSQAAAGEHVELTGDANATGAASISSSATMLVAGRAVHSSSPSTPTIDGAVGPVMAPLPPFPPMTGLPVTLSGISVGIRLTNPTLLFPTVSPSSGPSAPLPSASHIQLGTTAAGLLPSGPSPMGAQEFGVAILAAAIAIGMVIPWLPRRTRPRGAGHKR